MCFTDAKEHAQIWLAISSQSTEAPFWLSSSEISILFQTYMKFFDRRKLADAAASSLHGVCDSVTVYLLHLSGAPVAGLVCEITFPPPLSCQA